MVRTKQKVSKNVEVGDRLSCVRVIDYDAWARESGEEAYRRAREAGLPEPIAQRFKRVFGAPIEPEFRM